MLRFFNRFLLGAENGAFTAARAAAALIQALHRRRMLFLELDAVVVAQLLARSDRAQRLDVDAVLVVHRFAVGCAAVVDPACAVAAATGVDHHAVVEREQEGMRAVVLGVAPVHLCLGEAFAGVFDQTRALGDARNGEHALAVDAGTAHDETAARLAFLGCHQCRFQYWKQGAILDHFASRWLHFHVVGGRLREHQ